MRKVVLLTWSSLLLLNSASYADLGDIKVKSYLSQKFDAVVPLTNMPKDVDYNNLNFGLASGAKFKEYGVDFNHELGSFVFKIVSSAGSSPYVIISSSKPINSPVLNFLLHYKVNKDDFYRQYTVLLDPVDYSNASAKVSKDKVIVVRSPNKVSTYALEKQKPIPIYSNTVNSTVKPSYQIDLSSPELRQYLKRFNQESMLYSTESGDSLYLIARLNQLLYPKAQLTINQVLVALGMENYHKMHDPEYLYESGVLVAIPLATKISLISTSLADEYLLDVSLTNEQKVGVLKAIASKYNSTINIESSQLFLSKPQLKMVVPPTIKRMPHKALSQSARPQSEAGEFTSILNKMLWVLLALMLGLMLIIIKRRYPDLSISKLKQIFLRKKKREILNEPMANTHSATYDTLNKFSHHRNLAKQQSGFFEENSSAIADSIEIQSASDDLLEHGDGSANGGILASDDLVITQDANNSGAELPKASNVDHDLIATLEKILLMDSSRNDIRYKLFELYLMSDILGDASKAYYGLDNGLDNEDPLRHNIEFLCQKYNFTPLPEDQILNSLDDNAAVVDSNMHEYSVQMQPEIKADSSESVLINDDIERIVDFVSFAPTSSVPDPEEVINFSQERILDFSAANYTPVVEDSVPIQTEKIVQDPLNDILHEDNSSLTNENSELDEKINLARMYFHIEEPEKAKEIINDLLANDSISEDAKIEINKLKAEVGFD